VTPAAPTMLPSHWNKPVRELGVDAGHVDLPGQQLVQAYVCDQVGNRMTELRAA
jgi:hypothetical protein